MLGVKGEGSENRGKDMNRPDCDCTVTPVRLIRIAHKHLLYWFANLPDSGLRLYWPEVDPGRIRDKNNQLIESQDFSESFCTRVGCGYSECCLLESR